MSISQLGLLCSFSHRDILVEIFRIFHDVHQPFPSNDTLHTLECADAVIITIDVKFSLDTIDSL